MAIDETTGRELIQVLTVCVREEGWIFLWLQIFEETKKHGFKNKAQKMRIWKSKEKTVKNHRKMVA